LGIFYFPVQLKSCGLEGITETGGFFILSLLPQKDILWAGFNGKIPGNFRDYKIIPCSNGIA
jgi:hypothetical protein